MENMRGSMEDSDTTIHTDARHRMGRRPLALAVNTGEGLGFQDIGSSFGDRASGPSSSQRPTKTYKSGSKRSSCTESPQSSEDELLLSEKSAMSPVSSRKPTGSQTASAEQTVRVNVNGKIQDLPWHPDYKQHDTLKKLRFNKTKKTVPEVIVVDEEPPPSSSFLDPDLDQAQDIFEPISHDVLLGDDSGPSAVTSPQPPSAPTRGPVTRRKYPSPTRPSARSMTENKKTFRSKPSSKSLSTHVEGERPPPKIRPKPRIIYNPGQSTSPDSTPRASGTTSTSTRRTELLRARSPVPFENNTSNKVKPGPRPKVKQAVRPTELARRVPEEFPMSLSAKENVSDGGSSTDHGNTRIQNKGKGKGKAPSSSASTTKRLQPETTFPTLSPLRPSTHYSEKPSKGKNRSFPLEEHTDGNDTRGSSRTNMRPFPMSVELLESIDHSSPTGSLAKRVSDGSDAEHKRASKKLKDSVPSIQHGQEYFDDFHMEDDSIDVGYAKDPSTLCPYCDEQLPPHPTPFLQSLMSKARRKSYPDPRPRNSCGLRAPLAIYISVCQRHRFELLQLPIALERGWPQVINFQNVPKRVMRMKVELEAIILARDDCGDVNGRSVFWREVKKEVKDQGSRTVVGVKGQFASFEKTQPGYYGEQGSVIIHQTLFNLFPPSSFNVSLIAPLTPTEFTQRVLVPETATRLIAQDLDLTIEDAITTLRESAQYGIAMFPDTDTKRTVIDEDDDEMGVADQIVMERARARRRELEEEERIEEEMIEEATCEAKARKEKPSKRVKNTRRAGKEATVAESDGLSSNSEVSTWSQTTKRGPKERQRPVAISQPAQDEQSDAMSVDSSTSKRSRVSVKAAKCSVQAKQSHRPPWTTGFDVAEAIEVVDITTPNSAKHTSLQELTKATRATSSLYPVDGNDECTPRPQRFKSSTVIDIPPSSGQSSDPSVPVHPLHVARNRTQTSTVNGVPGTSSTRWHRSFRSNTPVDLSESDTPCGGRSSRPVVRDRKETADETTVWLFSEPSSPCDY